MKYILLVGIAAVIFIGFTLYLMAEVINGEDTEAIAYAAMASGTGLILLVMTGFIAFLKLP